MGFYDRLDSVNSYIEMVRGYDGRAIIAKLDRHLPAGAAVLELGMGPGVDLDILAERSTATGSDNSAVFLDLYRERHPKADLLQLDALTIDTERRFDCIYSNKVLHHLRREDLSVSFVRQRKVLQDGGIACHSFWRGSGEEYHEGMRFVSYHEDELQALVASAWEVLELSVYREMDDDDSVLLIMRKV